jgi:integrase
LGKTNSEEYTCHCFRRTAATILADTGASISTLKSAGGWKSSEAAERYIAESLPMKRSIADAFEVDSGANKAVKAALAMLVALHEINP